MWIIESKKGCRTGEKQYDGDGFPYALCISPFSTSDNIMKKQGHYCKICGKYKANEKFSGKGHANHICKDCASLPADKKAEQETLNRIRNLPFRLSDEQKNWLKNRTKDDRPAVRMLAQEEYDLRFRYDFNMDSDEEELAMLDAEMQEEIDFQRHLTPEIFATINPNGKLLDFEIFKAANAGDAAAIEKVLEYHHNELWGYMLPEPDEIDMQVQADLLRAFRQAIGMYKIHPDDTYYCYDEILDMAHRILDAEDAAEMAFLMDDPLFLS